VPTSDACVGAGTGEDRDGRDGWRLETMAWPEDPTGKMCSYSSVESGDGGGRRLSLAILVAVVGDLAGLVTLTRQSGLHRLCGPSSSPKRVCTAGQPSGFVARPTPPAFTPTGIPRAVFT
jgi:hypothetical protein